VNFTFRPLPVWPHPVTDPRRGRYTFKASWSATLRLLAHELLLLNADNPVIGAGFREQDLRLDGLPRADARMPTHPGIEISFDTPRFGRLVYATDSCEWWEHNVRSIALGLESLRAVDRFGITRRGEQYAGWRQLTAGPATDYDLVERGRAIIAEHGSVTAAIKATHPDAGGDADDFRAITAAREADG
jgi:hypothetical protein